MKWVDEYAWLTATRDYPGYTLVTRAMDDIDFRIPVPSGSILRFNIRQCGKGTSSVTYTVNVYADPPNSEEEDSVFSTSVTFVSIDRQKRKRALPDKIELRSEKNCSE